MEKEYGSRKRAYHGNEVIDAPFLINAPRALTEKELKKILPSISYSYYISSFLRRRFKTLFSEIKAEQWFLDRYFNTETTDVYSGDIKKCIQLSGIRSNTPISDVFSNIKTSFPTAKLLVSQGTQEENFERTVFVVDDSIDMEKGLGILQGSFKAKIIDISDLKVENRELGECTAIRSLFEEVVKYERWKVPRITDELIADTLSTNDPECYSRVLRDYFYFCTCCCKKYDNQIEMKLRCSKHTAEDFCERRRMILSYPKNIEYVRKGIETLDLHYKVSQEQNYMCKECDKTFASVEFVGMHLRNKHEDIVSNINEGSNRMVELLDKIDFFMFDLIFGTGVSTAPAYGECNVKEDVVVYDIPSIFSGNDIKLV